MVDRTTHFLVTLAFDENLHIGKRVDTELSFKNEIVKNLQRLIEGGEIEHFIVADNEVINDKLKEELKTGHWIDADEWRETVDGFEQWGYFRKCSECGYVFKFLEIDNYCPNCGARMIEPQESEGKD